jgi:8-oxo-dGTP diphosphatase
LAIQIEQRLCEGTSFVDTLELLAEVADRTVLCSHGDVIPDTIEALVRRGLSVRGEADWRKASVWVIERDVSGCFTDAIAWPPPAIELP